MKEKDRISHAEFERLVARALAGLPEEFQDYLENVAVVIEEEPPADEPDLTGLYEGVPLVERSAGDIVLPDRIIIYKGPILRACRSSGEAEAEIAVTVLHEVGHHFGLDEEQLESLENKFNTGSRGF